MIADPSPLRLESDFAPTPASPEALTLRLHNGTARPLTAFKLAMSGMFRIEPDAGMIGGTFIELAAAEAGVLHGGGNLTESGSRGARR